MATAVYASSSWLVHLKTYVDPDLPASQQIDSRDAIANLISQKVFSLSQLVLEMGDILTSTDAVVRARGILLLGELSMQLLEKPMGEEVIHHFAAFFSSRLEDWHSLHGALLGSLALLKRGKDVGALSTEDAITVLQSALENLQVQALSQQNRMLCLELFECFLLCHSEAVTVRGAIFAERLCDIIDGEKDPRCLLIGFHIIELAAQSFPDPVGHIGRVSEELFGIISCYFPISFNPAPDDKREITREDLSVALMHCFGSTKLFADFCIPFLLEKLSSTLQSAKRDSLKFLGFCVLHYGKESLQKHSAAIWVALKPELLSSHNTEEISSRKKNDVILKEALDCLEVCLRPVLAGNENDVKLLEKDTLLDLVLQDAFLDDFFNCLRCYLVHVDQNVEIPSSGMSAAVSSSMDTAVVLERALATVEETGSILAVAVKASPLSCFAVSQNLFDRLIEVLKPGICSEEVDVLNFINGVPMKSNLWFPSSFVVAVLVVLSSVVEGAREVAARLYESTLKTKTSISDMKWIAPLQSHSQNILMLFVSIIISGLQNTTVTEPSVIGKSWKTAVAGLQAVGSFPPEISALSSNQYAFLVTFLKTIILKKSEVLPLWNQTVEATAAICSMQDKFLEQGLSFGLADTLISLLFEELLDDHRSLSVRSSLRVLSILCNGRPLMLTSVLRKLTGVVCEDLKRVIPLVDVEDDSLKRTVQVLQGVFDFILPCCASTNVETKALVELAIDTWNVVENLPDCECAETLADNMGILGWYLEILQFSVSRCDELSQKHLLLKILNPFVGASSRLFVHPRVQDVWIIGFFASTIIALLPSIPIPEEKETLCKLLEAAVSSLCNTVNIVAYEAVGCMLNKWHASIEKGLVPSSIEYSITEATDLIIKGKWISGALCHQSVSNRSPLPEEALLLKTKCIKLLASAGKGLAMRGHIAVSDIAMLLLNLVQCKKSLTGTNSENLLDILWPNDVEKPIVSCAAAEALGFIAKDSKSSICKQNHFIIKPLYQQRFFVSMLPPLMLVLKEADEQQRVMLYYAFGNMVAGIPTSVILAESYRAFPLVLESLSALSGNKSHSGVLLSALLALSEILVDKHAAEVASHHVPAIISRLVNLINYGHLAMVRETSLLCLGALVALPYTRVFPFRTQVSKSLTIALDDPKRTVRKEAIRCRRAWDSLLR